MAKSKFIRFHEKLGRGLMVVLLGGILLFPLFGMANLSTGLFSVDKRKVIAMPGFNARKIDKDSSNVTLFNEPLLSITFDDGRESVYSNALPLLNKYGVKTTQYLLSGVSDDQQYLSEKQIAQFNASGHEIACHSDTHPDLTTLDTNQLTKELSHCKQTFSKYGIVNNFASPFGHSNSTTIASIKNYFLSHRNTDGDITNGVNDKDVNTKQNLDRYNIISASIRSDTTIEELRQAVDYTIKNNGWLVLTYHQIEDSSNSTFGLDPDSLDSQLSYLSSAPIKIVTMQQALSSLGQ